MTEAEEFVERLEEFFVAIVEDMTYDQRGDWGCSYSLARSEVRDRLIAWLEKP